MRAAYSARPSETERDSSRARQGEHGGFIRREHERRVPCRDYCQGKCYRGAACRFSHDELVCEDESVLRREKGGPPRQSNEWKTPNDQRVGVQPCGNFNLNGHCDFPICRFTHLIPRCIPETPVDPLRERQDLTRAINLPATAARVRGARYMNSGLCCEGRTWCRGPTSEQPTVRSLLEVHRCAKCAELSEQVWRSMAPDTDQFLRPGDDEEAWNWLLPGARFRAGRDRFGSALPASAPPFPDSHTHEWRKIPAGIHIGAAAEAIRGTLPEHGQGV